MAVMLRLVFLRRIGGHIRCVLLVAAADEGKGGDQEEQAECEGETFLKIAREHRCKLLGKGITGCQFSNWRIGEVDCVANAYAFGSARPTGGGVYGQARQAWGRIVRARDGRTFKLPLA